MVLGKNIVKVILHIIAWALFVFLNFLFIKGAGLKFVVARQSILLATSIVVFYLFYVFIAPLLFKKRILLFIFTSLVIITGAVYVNQFVQQQFYIKKIGEIHKGRIETGTLPEVFREKLRQEGNRPLFVRKNLHIMNSSLYILFFVLVSLLLRFVQKWQYDEKTKYILEKEKSDAELLFLKQQINPHFLFNSLNSIYSLANKKSDLAAEAIIKLSAILRYVLYHSEKNQVPLVEEIETLENYIELQRLRITKKVILNYNIEGNPGFYFIEPLLLMPIFENAFKYGVDSISESFIDILIKISNGKLILDLRNKIVPQKDKLDEESGIGLKNIKRRLELLYPNNFEFNTNEQKQVFRVTLELKLRQ